MSDLALIATPYQDIEVGGQNRTRIGIRFEKFGIPIINFRTLFGELEHYYPGYTMQKVPI